MKPEALPRLIDCDRTVRQVYGNGYGTPRVGIEVELENITADFPECKYWNAHDDGSLRNHGREFVSTPLLPNDVSPACAELHGLILQQGRGEADASYRCGVHVHYNVGHLKVGHLLDNLLSLMMIEPLLFAVYAPHRSQSVFCVPWYRSGRWLQSLAGCGTDRGREFGAVDYLETLRSNVTKYQSINVLPVQKYGTIEFRMFPSSTDSDVIKEYADTVLRTMRWLNTVQASEVLSKVYSGQLEAVWEAVFAGNHKFEDYNCDTLRTEIESAVMSVKNIIYSV